MKHHHTELNRSADRWRLIEQILEAIEDAEQVGPDDSPRAAEFDASGDHVHITLSSRIQVERATGILAERHHISVPEALDLLRAHGRRSGLSLDDMARALIED